MRDGERVANTGQNTGNGKANAKGTENNQFSPQKPKGTEKGADLNKDVYELDERLFPAGPYYNVKAARLAQAEEEIVVGRQHMRRGRRQASRWLGTRGSSRRRCATEWTGP